MCDRLCGRRVAQLVQLLLQPRHHAQQLLHLLLEGHHCRARRRIRRRPAGRGGQTGALCHPPAARSVVDGRRRRVPGLPSPPASPARLPGLKWRARIPTSPSADSAASAASTPSGTPAHCIDSRMAHRSCSASVRPSVKSPSDGACGAAPLGVRGREVEARTGGETLPDPPTRAAVPGPPGKEVGSELGGPTAEGGGAATTLGLRETDESSPRPALPAAELAAEGSALIGGGAWRVAGTPSLTRPPPACAAACDDWDDAPSRPRSHHLMSGASSASSYAHHWSSSLSALHSAAAAAAAADAAAADRVAAWRARLRAAGGGRGARIGRGVRVSEGARRAGRSGVRSSRANVTRQT
eukprot:scaffold6021_cov117-Isochrysis_galbana.AAC.26